MDGFFDKLHVTWEDAVEQFKQDAQLENAKRQREEQGRE